MKDDDQEKKDILKPNEYDGIREYDNQLPRWWINGFYISIVFAILYIAWYESGMGPNLFESFQKDKSEEMDAAIINAAKRKSYSEEELNAMAQNPEVLKLGAEQFHSKCVSCHAADGGGLVGPNLTDAYWIHGNKINQIVEVITRGVPAKGMPNWGALMSEAEIIAAAAFVRSLQGKTPATPKVAEGEFIK